jgi:ubiquinone/menaquinone biosynthesis C-methylase UbiE
VLKYYLAAAALKSFSATQKSRWLYRRLGNTVGVQRRRRHGVPRYYVDRAKQIVDLCRNLDALREGDHVLEVGTGWVHWEATAIRMFFDVNVTLFDIWDNRQLSAYKLWCQQLKDMVQMEVGSNRTDRALNVLETIAKADSFDDIYRQLGFRYVVNPNGTLDRFSDGSFDLIVSCSVLEHVNHSIIPGFTRDFYRLLRPGGLSTHAIDLCDHLAYYDSSAPRKNYLKYANSTWERYLQNDVQYFNRVQRDEWLELFEKAGLVLVEEKSTSCAVDVTRVDPLYQHLSMRDLECANLHVVHRKSVAYPPLDSESPAQISTT